MAFTLPQPQPQSRRRPGVVTTAVALLYFVAAVEFLNAFTTIAVLSDLRSAYERVYADMTDGDMAVNVAVGSTVAVAVVYMVIAIAWVVLALLDGKGKNPARIVTWVLGGLFLCCAGIGLALSAAGSAVTSGASGTSNAPSSEEIRRAMTDALPSWYQPTQTVTGVLMLLALLAVVILLALPAANEYFRKRQPELQWEVPPPPAMPTGPMQAPPYGGQGPVNPQGVPPTGPPPVPPATGPQAQPPAPGGAVPPPDGPQAPPPAPPIAP